MFFVLVVGNAGGVFFLGEGFVTLSMRAEERGEQMEEIWRDRWAADGEWEGKTGRQRGPNGDGQIAVER
jgi:hypothetical protein